MKMLKCPVCGSDNIYQEELYYDTNHHAKIRKIKCKTCNHRWNIYDLFFILIIENFIYNVVHKYIHRKEMYLW